MINKPNLEVDIALGDFKALKVVGEIKWKRKIKEKELTQIKNKLRKFNCKKIIIVPDKRYIKEIADDIEVYDLKRIMNLIKK